MICLYYIIIVIQSLIFFMIQRKNFIYCILYYIRNKFYVYSQNTTYNILYQYVDYQYILFCITLFRVS